MALPNFDLDEILKQFTKGQKLFVLIFTLAIVSLTTIITTYVTASCEDLRDVNASLREDNDQCKLYNEILIKNNLMIIEKTNELHIKIISQANIRREKEQVILNHADSLDSSLMPMLIFKKSSEPEGDETFDELVKEINEIAKSVNFQD